MTGAGAVALGAASTGAAQAATPQTSGSDLGQPVTGPRRIAVVTDSAGNVIAGYLIPVRTQGSMRVGIAAMPGQSLHELDMPAEMAGSTPEQIMGRLGAYRVRAGTLAKKGD